MNYQHFFIQLDRWNVSNTKKTKNIFKKVINIIKLQHQHNCNKITMDISKELQAFINAKSNELPNVANVLMDILNSDRKIKFSDVNNMLNKVRSFKIKSFSFFAFTKKSSLVSFFLHLSYTIFLAKPNRIN